MTMDAKTPTRFYLVWSPTGLRPPAYRHPTRAKAEAEAERLAKFYPTEQFFVLAAISVSTVPPITTQLVSPGETDADDIPF